MIEEKLERKIIQKIKSLNIPNSVVYGIWGESSKMYRESSNKRTIIVVKVPTRGFDTFGICEVQFDIAISFVVRLDMCKDGNDVTAAAQPLVQLMSDWNLVERSSELEDFKVEGFYPGGVQINQGNGPDIDKDTKTISNTFNIILRGTVECGCNE